MATSMTHQKDAVQSGFWPLYRYDPRNAVEGENPFQLDSKAPTIPVKEFQAKEARFAMLARSRPVEFEALQGLAQADADERRRFYEQLAGLERHAPGHMDGNGHKADGPAETKGVDA
jgi:pyruvate-ferredoxin/flavodoxin oxidoreductase